MRDIPGTSGYYEMDEGGNIFTKARSITDSLCRTRHLKPRPVAKQNGGKGVYLHLPDSVRSVSVSTLLRETFPESVTPVYSEDGEEWRVIPGWHGYEASSFGRLKRLERKVWNGHGEFVLPEMLLCPTENQDGYLTVQLNDGERTASFMVHRLVAMTFHRLGGAEEEVNHKDFDRLNNHKDNLEWLTHVANVEYSREAGNYKKESVV
jgi:hypothetical protein